MIKIKIDVTKMDKGLFFHAKSGAVYADIIAIETPNSNYSDFMLVMDLPKERREDGEKGAIIGNASRIMPANQPNDQQSQGDVSASEKASESPDNSEEIPF